MTSSEISTADVQGVFHDAAGSESTALAITHGAGGDMSMPLLIAVAGAFVTANIAVLRFRLPFRKRRAKGAPHPSGAADDRAGIAAAIAWLRARHTAKVIVGGQSYGGRQASMLLAEQPELAQALLLLSYPLHPPGKPEQLRVDHLPNLRVPTLFVHGTRDPFGSPEEMRQALLRISSPQALSLVDAAGHDLKGGRFALHDAVVAPLTQLLLETR